MSGNEFNICWDTHCRDLRATFPNMLYTQRFVDVTLACDGQHVQCHRVILAASSTYLAELLDINPGHPHPLIILPKEVKFFTLQALLDFMYTGEMKVMEDQLEEISKTAELLQIPHLNRMTIEESIGNVKNGDVLNSEPMEIKEEPKDQDNLEENEFLLSDLRSELEIAKPLHDYYHHHQQNQEQESLGLWHERSSYQQDAPESSKAAQNLPSNPPEHFVLARSIRRKSFSRDTMWAAMMDVKNGMSYSGAAKKHKISSGHTVSNYCGRYGISSKLSFPSSGNYGYQKELNYEASEH